MALIETHNLVKKYNNTGTVALKGIDMSVGRNEFLGLLGPNSAGKTTLISIICGLLRPTSGKVMLFGNDAEQACRDVNRRIGLVPQDIALYANLTVWENILFFGHLQDYHGKELNEKAEQLLEKFNLQAHRYKLISHCSGGIKRRVNLIGGIIHKPELLILDEPTLGVDTQLREMIFGFLKDLNRNGTTIIYTTHYMKEAELLCSRIQIIDNGLVIADGEPAGLIAASEGCTDLGQVFMHMTGRDLRD